MAISKRRLLAVMLHSTVFTTNQMAVTCPPLLADMLILIRQFLILNNLHMELEADFTG